MTTKYTDEQIREFADIYLANKGETPSATDDMTPLQLRAMMEWIIEDQGVPVRKLPEQERLRNFDAFHKLWTASLTSPNYDKKAWMNIEKQMQSAGVI